MAKDKPNKLPFTLFLISLSLHLIVFAASSHEYVWSKPVKPSQPIKFRVVSVEKPEEKLPPNRQSRNLSNANRKESGAGKPGKTPRLRREDRDRLPSRRGVVSPEIASLAPAPKPKVPPPAALPVSPKPPAVVTPKPEPKKVEKPQEKRAPETSEIAETPKPREMASLAPAPEPSPKTPPPAIQEKAKPKPTADETPDKRKIEAEAIPKIKNKPKPVVKQKPVKQVVKKEPRKGDQKIEAKGENTKKPEMAASSPAPKPKAQVPAALPVSPKPPAVVTPKPEPKKVEKPQERKAPETLEIAETPKPTETASLAPAPEPSQKVSTPVLGEKIKPKLTADETPDKKKIEAKALPKKKPEPKPVIRKKAEKKVVRKKPRKENKKVEAKKQTKEKVELAALKPVSRPVRPRPPAPKRPQPKDPLALFRVKPQPKGKPELPKFDLSDEAADRIAKKSSSDKELEREEGETISLDTRDFRYASYFAHIKRRIQNAWIWPAEAQKNRGELLLRFKLRKNGTLEDVRLIRSAGVRILDDLAMAAVAKAAPFEPFPEGLERKAITATFVYE